MKRYIYIIGIVLAAAALLSGCVSLQTERVPGYISFEPLVGHDTRAVESVPFPEDLSFKVWAVNQTSGETYIQDETIAHSPDGWKSEKMWPIDEMYFEAYWPDVLPMEFSTTKGLQLKGFDCTKGDVDVLVAKAYDDNKNDNVVSLRFDHILSRVEFRMMHSLSEGMSVRLKKIEMIGYATTGDYGLRRTGQWDVGEPDFSTVVYEAAETDGINIAAGAAQYIADEFYVIPQACTARLEVQYEIRYGTAGWIPESATIESLKTFWDPGRHYTYTLNLRIDKLTHTTAISSWDNRD